MESYLLSGKESLGIELGSTRIKAVLIDENCNPIASGGHTWENKYENGYWTYSLDDVWKGLQNAFADLNKDTTEKFGSKIKKLASIGFSAMMHGYLPFDENGNQLAEFRTWRNTTTAEASAELTELFNFNIPQRWSIAHLYQAVLNKEEHVNDISYLTTLAGYVHWKLSGEKVLGVGEASGMFPIDSDVNDYNAEMLDKFSDIEAVKQYKWKIRDILPKVLLAGDNAGALTKEGAMLLDPSGNLEAGALMCPPEGDAGTGMVATNSVSVKTGNVSAGTSIFAMVVLQNQLAKVYEEIDMVTTPTGKPVAMVHCNNCCTDLDYWVSVFSEFAKASGSELTKPQIYDLLYNKALEADADCGGIVNYNYFSGEPVAHIQDGRPLFVRTQNADFNLANFMR
ncbi:MAG: ATPase, partial [Eubacterium sp.]|nr:ATPase [Eubacterium sp.]